MQDISSGLLRHRCRAVAFVRTVARALGDFSVLVVSGQFCVFSELFLLSLLETKILRWPVYRKPFQRQRKTWAPPQRSGCNPDQIVFPPCWLLLDSTLVLLCLSGLVLLRRSFVCWLQKFTLGLHRRRRSLASVMVVPRKWIPRSPARRQPRRHWRRREERQRRRFIRLESSCSIRTLTRPSAGSSVSGLLHSPGRMTVHSGPTPSRAELVSHAGTSVGMAHKVTLHLSTELILAQFTAYQSLERRFVWRLWHRVRPSPSGNPVKKRMDLPSRIWSRPRKRQN